MAGPGGLTYDWHKRHTQVWPYVPTHDRPEGHTYDWFERLAHGKTRNANMTGIKTLGADQH